MVTKQEFDSFPNNKVFARGITVNSPYGANMVGIRIGDRLRWVAKKGNIDDWCIYCFWANESTFEMVETNGDKVGSRQNIMHILPCDEEVYKCYRR